MGKAPAFQFYANDFMDATRFWEANACGLFIRCLCIQWTQGGLPADVRSLSKGVGMDFEEFERAWKVVASKFVRSEDGLLRNSRLEDVRSRQSEIASKRSNAGKRGVFARANAKANGSTKSKQRKVKVEGEVEREEEGRSIVFPAWATPKFMEKWALWKAYKVEKRSPYKPIGEQSALMKLAKDFPGEAEAIAAIENSMGQNYQGIFASNRNGKKVLTNDEYGRAIAEAGAKHLRDRANNPTGV